VAFFHQPRGQPIADSNPHLPLRCIGDRRQPGTEGRERRSAVAVRSVCDEWQLGRAGK
jgi:hypothetical protein